MGSSRRESECRCLLLNRLMKLTDSQLTDDPGALRVELPLGGRPVHSRIGQPCQQEVLCDEEKVVKNR
ncbi:MAG: hypothetical protein CL878_15660 [Dehalococcoidia bacterium]|nr:hypothetical protein [Dehalococcoidia bacterium]